MWTAEKPFDFEGRFYHVKKAFSEVRSPQKPHAPIYFGGASDAAITVGAKHSDVYALFGEPRAAIQAMIERIRAEAAQYDRQPRFNISFRPIIARTEGEAWDKARGILAQLEQNPQKLPVATEAEFSRRLTRLADEGEVYDERLWTGLVKISGANGNTTALVGTRITHDQMPDLWFRGLLRAANLMTDHVPLDMPNDNTRTNLLLRCTFDFYPAVSCKIFS